MATNYRPTTPHAAVKIWNFNERLGAEGSNLSSIDNIDEVIISTVSCTSIQTSKSKGNPVGGFTFTLAPTRNWLSSITVGSWCAILMSDQPIDQSQLDQASPTSLKMIGKIESVVLDTTMMGDGTRVTQYVVSGSDWGHIFNNVCYIDNLIAQENDPKNQGNTIAAVLQNAMLSDGNTPQSFKVDDNLSTIIGIFGISSAGIQSAAQAINRVGKSVYDFLIPTDMARFCNFVDADGNINLSTKISDILTLQTGKLAAYDDYEESNEAFGYINPFDLQGTHTFWQILMDNSNPALNEMYNEIEWDIVAGTLRPSLTIYNRIKPFSFRDDLSRPASAINILSPFNFVKTHVVDNVRVNKVTASTNWRDKYNFVEIRPQFSDFNVLGNLTEQKTQGFDEAAFNREGFRPLVVGTKQFPVAPDNTKTFNFNTDYFEGWVALLKEWYFDTHKTLSGRVVIYNNDQYISVGNNVLFEVGLVNPSLNINSGNKSSPTTNYILGHVENVRNSFSNIDGTRTYFTEVDYVRGLVVDSSRNIVGDGTLDQMALSLLGEYGNSKNTIGQSGSVDPDPSKLINKV